MKLALYVLFGLSVLGLLPLTPVAADTSYEQVAPDTLKNVATGSIINDQLYFITHKKSEGKRYKKLFRMVDESTAELELLKKVKASFRVTDIVFEFNDALYMTATKKKGEQVVVYRSNDDGSTWANVAQIGFADQGIRNEIVQYFTFNDRLFIVLTQHDLLLSQDILPQIAIWSTANGTDWESQVLTSNNAGSTHFDYKNFTITDSGAYILIDQADGPALYQSTDSHFSQVGITGLYDADLLVHAYDMVSVNNQIIITGRLDNNYSSEYPHLVITSTNGADWTVLQDVTMDGYSSIELLSFQETAYILHQTDDGTTAYQTDGESIAVAEFGFESDLSEESIAYNELKLVANGDGSAMYVYLNFLNDSPNLTVYCGITAGEQTWTTPDHCATDPITYLNDGPKAALISDDYMYDGYPLLGQKFGRAAEKFYRFKR